MKVIFVALTLVVMGHAFNYEEIPPHMKDRLDRIIVLKQQWEQKWNSMSEQERTQYETALLARMEKLPEVYFSRIHARIAELSDEHRIKLLSFLRARFPKEDPEQTFANELEEIDSIFTSLPQMPHEKLMRAFDKVFQQARAYSVDTDDSELDFPDVPELIEIPDVTEAAAFSGQMQEDLRNRIDEFLMKREDWKIKWEQLSEEKKALFESYIEKHL
jgi:hypothetical protein